MSEQVQIAFFTQLPLILSALGVLAGVLANIWVSVRNGRKLDTQKATLAGQNLTLASQEKKADTLIQSTDTIHHKTAHIERLVNSASDEMKATIAALRADAVLNVARIEQLTALIVTLNETIATANLNIERLTLAAGGGARAD